MPSLGLQAREVYSKNYWRAHGVPYQHVIPTSRAKAQGGRISCARRARWVCKSSIHTGTDTGQFTTMGALTKGRMSYFGMGKSGVTVSWEPIGLVSPVSLLLSNLLDSLVTSDAPPEGTLAADGAMPSASSP